MIQSPISQPSDHPLSPTLENGNRLAGGVQAATDDPLSPQLDNDDDDDEEEDARYNRINPRPARDMSLSSTYSESDTIYNDQETDSQPNPPSSSKRNSHLGSNSNGLRNGAMGKGKGKGWIAGTASTERLTTSSSESMASSGGGGNANGGKPRIASAASSIDGYSNTNSNAGSDDEEKNVQANLERWAAEERQRRKAARSSRTSSMMLAPPSGVGGSLARRLSHLGRKPSSSQSNSNSTLKSDLPQYRNGNDSLLRRGSRTESVSSIETTSSNGFGPQNGTGNHAPESTLEDVPEAEISDAATEKGHSPGGSSRKAKGKGRAVEGEGLDDSWNSPTDGNTSPARRKNDPFRDPGSNSSSKRNSNGGNIYSNSNSYHTPIKPTATRPIVTVGRAPSIASRQRSSNNPSIVQTDHDADSNPFYSNEDSNAPKAASSGKGVSGGNKRKNKIILEGDENEESKAEAADLELSKTRSGSSTITSGSTSSQPRPIASMAPPRKSTSSSRFNELDISDVENESGELDNYNDGPSADKWRREERKRRERRREEEEQNESERERERMNRTWWTDWLCGCGPRDDDEEQAGKTMPDL